MIRPTGIQVRVGDALVRLRPSIDLLLERAQQAGAARRDLRSEELIALLAAVCQEAMADEWSEPLCRRALSMLYDGIRPTAEH